MSLEAQQNLHNYMSAGLSNISASLDPHQIPNDNNEQLIKAARAFAAGDVLNMSEEEILARLDAEIPAELVGVGYQGDDESWARGISEEEFRNDVVKQPISDRYQDVASNEADEIRGIRTRGGQQEYLTNPERAEESGWDRPDVAPQSAMRDALGQLTSARQQSESLNGLLAGVFGGNRVDVGRAAAVEGRLEDDLKYGKVQRGAEQSLAAEMVRRDAERFDPEVQEANNFRAQAEARQILRDDMTTQGGSFAAMRPSVNNFQDAAVVNGVFVDPRTGSPIAMQEPVSNVISGSNTPDTSQMLNAPKQSNAVDWVAKQLDAEAATARTQQYPQIDINTATSVFAQKVKDLTKSQPYTNSVLGQIKSTNIRSLDELQKTADAIVRIGQAGGDYFEDDVQFVTQPDGRKRRTSTKTKTPGISSVMTKLGLAPHEEQQLAMALNQIELANRSGIDNESKQRYRKRTGAYKSPEGVRFGSASALPSSTVAEGMSPIARVKGRNRAAFKNAESPDASSTMIGLVEGTPDRPSFIKGDIARAPEGVDAALRAQAEERAVKTRKPVDEKQLSINTEKAKRVKERAEQDNSKRADQMSSIIENMPSTLRSTRLRG